MWIYTFLINSIFVSLGLAAGFHILKRVLGCAMADAWVWCAYAVVRAYAFSVIEKENVWYPVHQVKKKREINDTSVYLILCDKRVIMSTSLFP
jgi:hypothetical protein